MGALTNVTYILCPDIYTESGDACYYNKYKILLLYMSQQQARGTLTLCLRKSHTKDRCICLTGMGRSCALRVALEVTEVTALFEANGVNCST